MNARPLPAWLSCSVLVLAGGMAWSAEKPSAKAPQVRVARPLAREVTDHEDFTGRTEAVSSVEVRARVTGYLDKVLFNDGAEVRRGDLLFEIDPRPYRADLARAEARLSLAEARLKRADADWQRAKALQARGADTREGLDRAPGDRDVAQAEVRVARATLELARLNLDFTRVQAPLDGRIGRRLLDPGNLVKADDTALATIFGQDPMYASFDLDERTALRLRRALREGRLKGRGWAGLPVLMGLADEEGFPHPGRVDFADNRVDPGTGTLRVRAVFDNPRPPAGPRLLCPGLFVRIRLTTSKPYKALLVPEPAVVIDQGLPFVFVIDDKDVAVYRRVVLGSRHDGLRAVKEGLKPGERVVVGGRQGLRPGMTVKPDKVPMPAPGPESAP